MNLIYLKSPVQIISTVKNQIQPVIPVVFYAKLALDLAKQNALFVELIHII